MTSVFVAHATVCICCCVALFRSVLPLCKLLPSWEWLKVADQETRMAESWQNHPEDYSGGRERRAFSLRPAGKCAAIPKAFCFPQLASDCRKWHDGQMFKKIRDRERMYFSCSCSKSGVCNFCATKQNTPTVCHWSSKHIVPPLNSHHWSSQCVDTATDFVTHFRFKQPFVGYEKPYIVISGLTFE